jgi:hypothetical protein
MHAGEQDDFRIDRLRPDRQRERIAQEVCHLLYLMGQYDGMFPAFQFLDPIPDLRGVINLHFLFLLFNLNLIRNKNRNNSC